MKKIILTLNILMSLLITACSNDDIAIPTPPTVTEGKTCEVSFWASIPEISNASRGALDEATAESVETLSLLVFDQASGLYLYKSDATLSGQVIENGIHKGKYTAQLQLSDEPRIIHFVANAGDVAFQANELAVLSQLTKSNNQDAYWQRAIATSITAKLENGTYTNVQAPGITGTTIKLVRNFARITLSAASNSGFTLAGFVLVNTATKGTVAPYMQATDGNYFPNYDTENVNGSAMTKYEALFNAGYKGVQPADATIDGTIPSATSGLYTTDPKYLYERTQEEKPVYIIAKRSTGKYYKIDILKEGADNEADSYYKIFRNFSYDITINSVTGDGYDTPEEAASKTASNNLSASVELKDLTNIAYGNERLFVSKTEIVWTSPNAITFKYKYMKNGVNSNTTVTSLIPHNEYTGGNVYDFSTTSPTIASGTLDSDGFSIITIPHTGLPTSGYKKQEVTIKAGSLSRTINLILLQPYVTSMGCSATSGLNAVPPEVPTIEAEAKSAVSIYFSLPEGLPESIFPLTFILSPAESSITPATSDMPVVSLLDHSNAVMKAQKYGFEKELEWGTDYSGEACVIECKFKTCFAENATTVYLYNEYFDLNKTQFLNEGLFLFTFGRMTADANTLTKINADTIITIYGIDGRVLGTTTYAELSAGTATVVVDRANYDVTVNQNNQNNKLCYFGFTAGDGKKYLAGSASNAFSVNQASSGTTLNFSAQ